LGKIPDQFSIEEPLKIFKTFWEQEKLKGNNKNALIKSIFATFKRVYMWSFGMAITSTLLKMTSPFLIKWIIDFIKNP
jgi:hypothetical protein